MTKFIEKYSTKIAGVLSGFDRLIFKGTLRQLSYPAGMFSFLFNQKVLLKDFGTYFQEKTTEFKTLSYRTAEDAQRPIEYIASSAIRKKDYAMSLARRDKITNGLICMIKSVEPCLSYDILKNAGTHKLELRLRERKCLYLYYYWQDREFGFMGARIQTWFPFTCYIYINGREWLSRMMEKKGIQFKKADNCFPDISDYEKATKLMNKQLETDWVSVLEKYALKINPLYRWFKGKGGVEYYWTIHQSEWATDITFKQAKELSSVYSAITRNAMLVYGSEDIMRFLGKKLHGNFLGEITSDYKRRAEGVRIKHSVNGNSIKSYDKHERILRVETTMNNPYFFKVFRAKSGEDESAATCRLYPLRKSVADVYRRSRISEECNSRYLDALSTLTAEDITVSEMVSPVCKHVIKDGRRYRALRLWNDNEQKLMESISKLEYTIGGFRNRDIRSELFGVIADKANERKLSAKVSRYFRLLRAHGIIRKLPHTHRYQVTEKGRKILGAVMKYKKLLCSVLSAA